MNYNLLSAGKNAPHEVNAIVEIPKGEGRIKYEYRQNGTLIVDRLRGADLPLYPVHYCGIPGTEATDGDPLDVLILCDAPFRTGDVVSVRPVALFWMHDEKGDDPKIIAVPADDVSTDFRHIQKLEDISLAERATIETFFATYKKNDRAGKWSKPGKWEDTLAAHQQVLECIKRKTI